MPAKRASWKRWLIGITLGLIVLLVGGVASIPWLLGTAPGRNLVLSKVNAAIAPGKLEVKSIKFSWSGPIRFQGLVLHAEDGKKVVVAPSATWDRGLWRLINDRPDYGTITLQGAACDITRREDGSIDLVDALGLGEKPEPEPKVPAEPSSPSKPMIAALKIVDGSLRLNSPELPHGLTADHLDLTLSQPAAPLPRSFDVALGRDDGQSLHVAGTLDDASAIALELVAKGWATDAMLADVAMTGTLDGKANLALGGETIAATGDARLSNVVATSDGWKGDRLAMNAVNGSWDVSREPTGWTLRRLDVTSPIGSLKTDRPVPAPPGESAVISGRIDLAAIAKQAPHLLNLRDGLDLKSGIAEVRIDVREDAATQKLDITAKVSDVEALQPGREAPIVLRDPATLNAALTAKGLAVTVESLGLVATGLKVQGSGDLENGVKLNGFADLQSLETQFGDLIDLQGRTMAGRARFAADYRRENTSFVVRYLAEVKDLHVTRPDAEPIAYDLVKLDGDVHGDADVTGVPTSWKTVRVGLGLPTWAASATLSPDPRGLAVAAVANRPGQGQARAVVLWTDAAYEIAELVVAMDAAPGAKPMELSGRGRYEIASGDLILEAIPGAPSGAVTFSPEGLKITSSGKPGEPTIIKGGLVGDLAAVDRFYAAFSGSTPYGVDGSFGVAIDAAYQGETDVLDLASLTMSTRYGSTGVIGTIAELSGRRDATLSGTLLIDKATLDSLVTSAVSPDARLTASVRPFNLRGPLSGDIVREIEVNAGLDIDDASAAGMRLGPVPLVAHLAAGKIAIEPIRSTLNGGEVTILADANFEDDGGMTVRLLPGTAIRDAVIDREVSEQMLSYVAPILHEATQVRGKVSMTMNHAEFPVGRPPEQQTSLGAAITFTDVIFGPGPIAAEILGLVPLQREPQVRLDETIEVAVANGRVYQKGLTVPVGPNQNFTLDGSVGFDHTLALQAMVPVPVSAMAKLGGSPATEGLSDLRVPVAIGGTFDHPRIDRRAMTKAIGKEGKEMLRREAASGLNQLIRKLGSEGQPPRR